MLRKRIIGLFVLGIALLGCGNGQSKSDKVKTLDSADQKTAAVVQKEQNILFFGTSLTAGMGLDPSEAFPALIQNKIDLLKLPYKVINGGLSGETSAGGKGRIDWLLKQPVRIFVLELGANDGLRGLPVAQTIKNLQDIIDRVKAKYPDAKLVLAGMQVPPNMGAKYAADFKNIFPELARKNDMKLIPFLLDKVGGIPKLNQADGIHPTAEGDKILAENVWVVLKDLL
ncbi:arylesterase [Pedobacter sp. HDW13]|uniref:arylesterase n=1 Tax=unclassified Pedobacter TaxID=2628915 RepID=UPI000F5B420D|nr:MULTISPECIES: arylesterase [unclassified Pedobacter]QIL40344.1 arylesterase [Pedobacter sp. HDW13]RQO79431.1 arylesterase [Pedobacter sp. KBW01]